ncbi:hypothetical protein BCU00_007085 [Vibrio breoganii]|uniref:hypothetical protein n=1 Tax=Vibrio breoganii TaxID=553239 RepID=UPI000C85C40B|nr:hypothetical protein [Vibrio breoganii]TKG27177.1 hypothetical protein FCV87_12060 [Vibrio breoganii]
MIRLLFVGFVAILLSACSNNPGLGNSVAQLKQEQVYNPEATAENQQLVINGSGERTQTAVKGYNNNKAIKL